MRPQRSRCLLPQEPTALFVLTSVPHAYRIILPARFVIPRMRKKRIIFMTGSVYVAYRKIAIDLRETLVDSGVYHSFSSTWLCRSLEIKSVHVLTRAREREYAN